MKTVASSPEFQVSIKGSTGHFSQSGYSKYDFRKGYDLEDCYGHISELREHIYEGKKIYENSTFVITTVVSVYTSIEV